jgi:hypothetical protein
VRLTLSRGEREVQLLLMARQNFFLRLKVGAMSHAANLYRLR